MILDYELIILGNGTDWCKYSLNKLIKKEKVFFFNSRLPIKNKNLLQIARLHYSYKLNEYINIPGKHLWYHKFCKDIGLDKNKKQILMIYDRNILGGEENFLKYIKSNYINVKLVYIFTNIVKYTGAQEKGYVHHLKEWYDVVFAFDPVDSCKYGFDYSPLIYDADDRYLDNIKKDDLVFYIGQAKDRLSVLIKSYEKLKQIGINTDFNIVKVDEINQKYKENIKYNKPLKYEDVLKRIQRSTCLIDIIQGDSTGLTIKNCEALSYGKKLITTNKYIKDYPFYDSRFIKIIDSPNDIPINFFIENKDVLYNNSNYFSSDRFLERLYKALNI